MLAGRVATREELPPVHDGHRDVQDDGVGLVLVGLAERLGAVRCAVDAVSIIFEHRRDELPYLGVVVHHEHRLVLAHSRIRPSLCGCTLAGQTRRPSSLLSPGHVLCLCSSAYAVPWRATKPGSPIPGLVMRAVRARWADRGAGLLVRYESSTNLPRRASTSPAINGRWSTP